MTVVTRRERRRRCRSPTPRTCFRRGGDRRASRRAGQISRGCDAQSTARRRRSRPRSWPRRRRANGRSSPGRSSAVAARCRPRRSRARRPVRRPRRARRRPASRRSGVPLAADRGDRVVDARAELDRLRTDERRCPSRPSTRRRSSPRRRLGSSSAWRSSAPVNASGLPPKVTSTDAVPDRGMEEPHVRRARRGHGDVIGEELRFELRPRSETGGGVELPALERRVARPHRLPTSAPRRSAGARAR